MTNTQRLVLVLAFILAILLGILLATTLFGNNGGSTAPTLSPAPSSGPPSTAPSSLVPSASEVPSASAAPSATPSPTPTATPGPAATIEFVQFALDATTDPGGTTRTIAFTGLNGPVVVDLKTESGGNTTACLLANGKQLSCRTMANGTLNATAASASTNYQVTLRGSGAATPVVDVTITFPATRPKVTVTDARFDGTADPAYNGLQVVATPRASGYYHVTANWGGHPFLYEVDLIEQGGPGLKTVQASLGATNVSQGFAVTPPNAWMIVLKNSETGFGLTGLTATFTWP
jgi:hypothetical protein